MIRAIALVTVLTLGCNCTENRPNQLTLSIRKTTGEITTADIGRLERRLLGVPGVTLVSVSVSGESLLVHFRDGTDRGHIDAALRETGFRIEPND